MHPTLLQKNLFRELFSLFVLSASLLLTLILIGRAVQMRELFLGLDLGLTDIGLLFLYMTPIFLMIVIPVACMFSVFLTFLRMNTDREFVALKAGGVSFYQMTPAPVIFSVLCAALTLWVSLFWLAWGMEHFRSTVMEIASTRAKVSIQPGIFNHDFPKLALYARKVDPVSGELKQVLVDDRSHPEGTVLILAPQGTLTTDSESGDLVFRLFDGSIYNMHAKGGSVLGFEEYSVRVAVSELLNSLDLGPVKPREMSWKTLRSFSVSKMLQSDPPQARKISIERHKRWVYPLACIALALFAMPLSAMFEGLHRQYGMLVALGTFFLYYAMLSFGLSTAESGALPPALALWLPNGLFFLTGLYGLRLANLERTPHVAAMLQFFRRTRLVGQ